MLLSISPATELRRGGSAGGCAGGCGEAGDAGDAGEPGRQSGVSARSAAWLSGAVSACVTLGGSLDGKVTISSRKKHPG